MFYFNPRIKESSLSTISTDFFENMSGQSHFEALIDGFWRSCPETSLFLIKLFTTRTNISHQFGCPSCGLSRKSFQLSGILISSRDFKFTLKLCYLNTPASQQMTIPHISSSQTEAHHHLPRGQVKPQNTLLYPQSF